MHWCSFALGLLFCWASVVWAVQEDDDAKVFTVALNQLPRSEHHNNALVALRGEHRLHRERSSSLLESKTFLLRKKKAKRRTKVKLITQKLIEQRLPTKHLATYYGRISVNGKEFLVLFDTGSCEFWIPSSDCTSSGCGGHNQLADSGDGPPMTIEYLSGNIEGKFHKVDVEVGGLEIKKQSVGLASKVEVPILDDVHWDGILGLAYPSPDISEAQDIYEGKRLPLFDTIMKRKMLDRNRFGYYITGTSGVLSLGGADCSVFGIEKCAKRFEYVPVTEESYWTIQFEKVESELNGEIIAENLCDYSDCRAIVDSGTYLMYTPSSAMESIGILDVSDCTDLSELPTLHFYLTKSEGKEPYKISLTPKDYVLQFDQGETKDCVAGISQDTTDLWTLGQVFLSKFYTMFDRDNDRIGFAVLPKHNPTV